MAVSMLVDCLRQIACLIGIILDIFLVIIISRQPNTNYTLKFMSNLAISNMEYLFSGALGYLGRVLILFLRDNEAELVKRGLRIVNVYLNDAGFRAAECFLVFVALTRWLQFARPGYLHTLFKGKKFVFVVCLCWFIPHAIYLPTLIDTSIFSYYDDYYAYGNKTFSRILEISDTSMNFGSLILQGIFNVMSCFWIISMRNNVMSPELRKNHTQEVKLFILCAIDSFVFLLAVFFLYLCILGGICENWLFSALYATCIINSCDSALLYLCLNRTARHDMAKLMKCCSGRQTVGAANGGQQWASAVNRPIRNNNQSNSGIAAAQHH